MDHKYWEEQLQAYLDRELDPADHRAVEKHMEDCADCKTHYEYFCALQKRLRAHAATVTIPPAVSQRLDKLFAPKRVTSFPKRWVYAAAAMAAIVILSLLLKPYLSPSYTFTPCTYIGKVVCHDCTVAHRAGLARGTLCHDGEHRLGLVTDTGQLFRFATDETGSIYTKDPTLYGDHVRVKGEVLKSRDLIRIQKLEPIAPKRASL